MLLGNLLYYDLVSYVICLCVFIPCWCVVVMMSQLSIFVGIIILGNEEAFLEFIWTVIPTLLVLVLCFLNVNVILYDSIFVTSRPVKVIGHQWYWSYEVDGCSYNSFMVDFINGVDKPLRLVWRVPYIILVSSADVIHSFSVPDIGIKIDAVPGRVNSVRLFPDRLGSFVGYCTELCGANHSYMPIVLEVVMNSDS